MGEIMKIKTRKDLESFRRRVHRGERHLDAVLENDIDLGVDEWIPIGDYTQSRFVNFYSGCFDGNGYTISGLSLKKHKGERLGLFACLDGAVIKNLTVEGEITGHAYYVGGIAGEIKNTTIKNCKNYVNCVGEISTGGICGQVVGSGLSILEDCVNYGDIHNERGWAHGIVGNLVDEFFESHVEEEIQIKNCRNEGELFLYVPGRFRSLERNYYRYNQIGGTCIANSTNKEKGKVTIPFHHSITALYLSHLETLTWGGQGFYAHFADLLASDPDPEIINEAGDTYLHLICRSMGRLRRNIDTGGVMRVIGILASETAIDFGETNIDGHEAAYYLRDPETGHAHKGFAPVIKLIEDIKKDRSRLGEEEEETFSEIGF